MRPSALAAMRRLANDPAATEGEREAARAKLTQVGGARPPPPRPPAPSATGAPEPEPWRGQAFDDLVAHIRAVSGVPTYTSSNSFFVNGVNTGTVWYWTTKPDDKP